MEISKTDGDFLKFTDAGEDLYVRMSEIIMVCKVKSPPGEDETYITLRNGKVFSISSTAEEIMLYLQL